MDEVKAFSLPIPCKKIVFPGWKFKFFACCEYQKCIQILLDDKYEAYKWFKYIEEFRYSKS
jgi:hypothetical protein